MLLSLVSNVKAVGSDCACDQTQWKPENLPRYLRGCVCRVAIIWQTVPREAFVAHAIKAVQN